ncbi:MAG: RNA polymerase sigma factor [Chloroflexi bacterium]|nr:RNA polymerase sigma factor [Chloroflexota bacterium]
MDEQNDFNEFKPQETMTELARTIPHYPANTAPLISADDVDQALVRAVAQGDPRALEELYQRHGRLILTYIIGQVGSEALAEEILQDVMLAVWQRAASFRAESTVYTWLLAIARRRAISARQKIPDESPLSDLIAADNTGPLEALEQQTEQARVREALRRLPADQREVLELIFYHDLSGPEAAAVLGVALGTVKSRLHRARTLLGRWLRLGEIR